MSQAHLDRYCRNLENERDKLQAEVEQLRQELAQEKARKTVPFESHRQERNILRQRCEALEADKARLDWLEERGRASTRAMFGQNGGFLVDDGGQVMPGTIDAGYEFTQLREALDAAIKGVNKS